ncbi:MAG: alpha/beta hydrolase [Levilactobacillus sp.]|uniref:alpha/beta fold hydrolase n=1 Tax=Levilactobacillus sp. TaxID=2767919 RepID=UPI0025830F08|nr:alpha/beta fold hydrolase [Levilactobacillus sp.]MCH4123640.1 alpha/beta hydrolase [Levilactobacillus sp.]MCI1553738.1 alpha/beta hydrolase [Levilactobacillus sp.]MCI1605883.1 alpha/beta hydrolase [Levilactobacillus sp.]
MKHRRGLTVLLTTLLVLGSLGGWWNDRWDVLRSVRVPQTRTATLFLPGTHGAWLSLRSMVTSLDRPHVGTFALTARVSWNGHVNWHQRRRVAANNPLVPVIFADNTHPHRQARQLTTVLTQLHRRYGVTRVNLVGHSSGGTIAYDYLADHAPAPVTVRRIAMVGADFPGRTRLRDHYPQLQILNLAGVIGRTANDSEVPVKTVTPLRHLVAGHVGRYQFATISGPVWDTQHSLLHENPALDVRLIRYLYPPS